MTDMGESGGGRTGVADMKAGKLRTFSTRLPKDLIHEVKIRSALDDLTVQEIADQALRLWLRTPASERSLTRDANVPS